MPLALTHSPVDPDDQMLTKHCLSRLVSRSDQDRNTKTTAPLNFYFTWTSFNLDILLSMNTSYTSLTTWPYTKLLKTIQCILYTVQYLDFLECWPASHSFKQSNSCLTHFGPAYNSAVHFQPYCTQQADLLIRNMY